MMISCIDKDTIKVVKTNVGNNSFIGQSESISFEFDKSLWTDFSYENDANLQFLKFQPEVKGSFSWVTDKILVFTPLFGEISPGVVYKVELTEEILRKTKGLNLPKERIFTFNSGIFDFSNVNYYWDKLMNSDNKMLNLNINMNYGFSPDSGKDAFQFKSNNKIVFPKNIIVNSTNEHTYLFDQSDFPIDSKFEIEVVALKGLNIGDGNKFKTIENISKIIEIVPYNIFTVISSTSNITEYESRVNYYFNHALNPELDFTKYVKINPSVDGVNFTVFKNQLTLNGGFEPGSTYQIELLAGLPSIFGTTLNESVSEYIKLGELEPFIDFVEKDAIYLPAKGSRKVAIKMLGVTNLYMHIYKVYENNIISMFHHGKSYVETYDESEEYYDYQYIYDISKLGEFVSSQKIDIKKIEKQNNAYNLKIDFKDYLSDKGIYIVHFVDSANTRLQVDRPFTVSDLGIIAKTNEDELFVSVNSLNTTDPLVGAKVSLISLNNQIMESLTTGTDGCVTFRKLSDRKARKSPKLLRVEKGGDINYLHLDPQTNYQKDAFDNLGGAKSSRYKAFIYGEREIYRPGDTLRIAGIVRDEYRKSITGIPIKLQLVLPNGKNFKEFVVETDKNGGFEFNTFIAPNVITGTYQVRAYLTGATKIGESKISIEQFIPERIKYSINTDKEIYTKNQVIKVNSLVENLFGTPAPNSKYDATLVFKDKEFKNRKLREYTFKISNNNMYLEELRKDGESDNKGKINFELPLMYDNIGFVDLFLSMNVYDEGNRPVRMSKKLEFNSQDYYVGIGKIDSWLNVNSNYNIPIVAVKENGESAGRVPVEFKLLKKNWKSVLRKSYYGDSYYYETELSLQEIMAKSITVDGLKGKVNFKTNGSGEYLVRASIPGSDSYVEYELMVYGDRYVNTGSFEINKDGFVDINTELEKYNTGDKARVLFTTPFNGRLIVTIERNGILDNYTLNTTNRTAELSLDIKDSYLPNIYISAILIRSNGDNSLPITVAYGYHSLIVEKKSTILPIEISVNSSVRSGTKQVVNVKTLPKKNVNVTISVVDEGIHQIKKSKTPNPHAFFYEKIANNIETYDVYKLVFPELKSTRLSYGGGESSETILDNLLINKFADERVKPVAYFSGILQTNSNGQATYTVDIPNFSGSLRVAAVAYVDDSFGFADTLMTVKDPIIISASIPRFMSIDDESYAMVSVSNTTNAVQHITLKASSSGPLKINSAGEYKFSIRENSSNRIKIPIKALNWEGISTLKLLANSSSESATFEGKLPIRYPAGYMKLSQAGYLNGKKSIDINITNNFKNTSTNSNIILSRLPIIEYFSTFDFLLNYPHGCTEQTISKAFPLLYYPELANLTNIGSNKNEVIDSKRMVISVIDRLNMLQLYSGGWGLWEESYTEHWWSTVYATHFLIAAKQAGYNVNNKVIDQSIAYIKNMSKNPRSEQKFATRDETTQINYYPSEALYGVFVLSIAGASDFSILNYYKSNLSKLDYESKLFLAAAYKMIGDNLNYKSIIAQLNSDNQNYLSNDNRSMSSALRTMAIQLYVFALADKTNPQIQIMTNNLAKAIKSTKRMSTQESVFAFLALGKVLSDIDKSKSVSGVVRNSKNNISELKIGMDFISANSNSTSFKINSLSDGRLYYFVSTYGIPKDGKIIEQDNGIKVRRTLYNRYGIEVKDDKFKSGELIVVKLKVTSTSGNLKISDMVISDLLPAGFEVENPRLVDIANYKWIKELNTVQSINNDYRDDRVNIYFDFDSIAEFYYTMRAITPGKYTLGAVTADAMYNTDIFSTHGAGKIIIEDK